MPRFASFLYLFFTKFSSSSVHTISVIQVPVLMVKSDSKELITIMKAECRYVSTTHGEPFVTQTGELLKLPLYVINLDFPHKVSKYINLDRCLRITLSIYLPIELSIHLFIYPPIHLLFAYLFIYLSIYLSTYLFIYLCQEL